MGVCPPIAKIFYIIIIIIIIINLSNFSCQKLNSSNFNDFLKKFNFPSFHFQINFRDSKFLNLIFKIPIFEI